MFLAQGLGAEIDFYSYSFLVWVASIVIIPILVIGLLKYAKWGMYLAFAYSIFHVIDGLIAFSIIKIAIHVIILYYLYKWKAAFG